MNDENLTAGEVVAWPFQIGFGVLAMYYVVFAEGFTANKLWTWYAEPIGFHAYGWKTFAAAALLFSMLKSVRPKYTGKDERSKRDQRLSELLVFVYPWLVLATGWWMK